MIRNQWYVILESREVGGKMKAVKRMGEKLILWRDASGKVSCLVDRCCHRGVALSAGKLIEDHVQCPFHGLEYDGTGRCTLIPANSRAAAVASRYRVPSYPVYEAHGWIWIWWGEAVSEVPEEGPYPDPGDFTDEASNLPLNASVTEPEGTPQYFPDIDNGFAASTVKDPWNTHYSRALENQLDVVHLPFVHHNTIGRGGRTVVDGPGVQWVNNRMLYTYVFNRQDDGTPPRKPSEVPVPPADRDYRLEMIMPNLWENRISEKLRIVAAFVPVDNSRTLLYLRTYRKFLRVPLLGRLVGRLFCRVNLVIAHQDRRVVETQTPKPSRPRGGEQLLQGDLPIIEYRKRRSELLNRKSYR